MVLVEASVDQAAKGLGRQFEIRLGTVRPRIELGATGPEAKHEAAGRMHRAHREAPLRTDRAGGVAHRGGEVVHDDRDGFLGQAGLLVERDLDVPGVQHVLAEPTGHHLAQRDSLRARWAGRPGLPPPVDVLEAFEAFEAFEERLVLHQSVVGRGPGRLASPRFAHRHGESVWRDAG